MQDEPVTQNQQNVTQYPPLMRRSTQLAITMVEAGIHPREALQTVLNKDKVSDQSVYELKNKAEAYSVATPLMQKLARNQIMRMLKGKAREAVREKVIDAQGKATYKVQMLAPSEANMLTAAQIVLDRGQPKAEERTGGNTTNIFNFDPRSSIKIAEIVTQAAGQLQAQQPASNQPAAQTVDAQVIDVPRLPDNTPTNTPDQW
jgi:hypothetical protein